MSDMGRLLGGSSGQASPPLDHVARPDVPSLSSVCTVDRIGGAPSGQFPRIARLVASAPVIFFPGILFIGGGNRDRRDEGHVERKHRIEGGRKARRVAEAQLLKGDLQGLSEGLQVAGLGRDVAPSRRAQRPTARPAS
jgi:hypothetical protein